MKVREFFLSDQFNMNVSLCLIVEAEVAPPLYAFDVMGRKVEAGCKNRLLHRNFESISVNSVKEKIQLD